MTPGSTDETADGMSTEKIDTIIEALRNERYQWTPVRRIYIEKKHSTKKRPLGLPTWSDKLVQEVIRLILDGYYEPQFSRWSHGFRPEKGCHTALRDIYQTWAGTIWYIEGDISACFDSLDHSILMSILAEKIHDNRFLKLIGELLQAGYLEDWKYHMTLSGSPQGGIVSPILSNIYLDRLDQFVETTLLPKYNLGDRRRENPAYVRIASHAYYLRKKGRAEEAKKAYQEARTLPTQDPNDPEYRRLRYVRYADDFLLGFAGSREEAEEIKQQLSEFLQGTLKLQLSQEKTLITHARTEAARFLGYEVSTYQKNDARDRLGRRVLNGKVELSLPQRVLKEKCQYYMTGGKPKHLKERTHDSVFSTIARYQAEYRGLVEYYKMAHNLSQLGTLKWVMETSLVKTLANKLKISVPQVYDRYGTTIWVENKPSKGLETRTQREGKKPLVAQWGGISLKRQMDAVLNDQQHRIWNKTTELEQRLLAETCELCGSQEHVEVHHIRALKDLKQNGRSEKPAWVKQMAAMHRKTLVLCRKCHQDVHYGRPRRQRHVHEQ
jgi:group II intron reverse transcriptase/maturase